MFKNLSQFSCIISHVSEAFMWKLLQYGLYIVCYLHSTHIFVAAVKIENFTYHLFAVQPLYTEFSVNPQAFDQCPCSLCAQYCLFSL